MVSSTQRPIKVMKSKGDPLPVFDGSLKGQGWSADAIQEYGKNKIGPKLRRGIDDRQVRDDRLRQWHLQYDAVYLAKDVPWPGSSALNIPTTRAIVDTIGSHTMHAFQGSNPLFRVESVDESPQDDQGAEAIEKLLQFQMTTQVGIRSKWDEITRFCFKDGNAVAYVPWIRTRKTRRDAEPMMVDPETQKPTTDATIGKPVLHPDGRAKMSLVERDEVDKDQPDVQVINMLNWAMYPADAPCLEKAIGCGFRVWANRNDLYQGIKDGIYDGDFVEELIKNGTPTSDRTQFGGDPVVDDMIGVEHGGLIDEEEYMYELFYLHWNIVIQPQQGIATDCAIIIDKTSGIIVSAQISPYWHGERPFVNYCPYPRDKAFYGYSLCEILEHIHAERNAIRNQRIDVGTLTLSPMLAVTRGVKFKGDRPMFMPGGVLYMEDVNRDVKPLTLGNVTQSAFAEEQAAKEMAEDVSGVNAYAQGQSPSRSRTVGEISTVVSEGNLKFEVVIGRLNEANDKLIQQIMELDYQFLPEEVEVAITGDNNTRVLQTITRDQIKKKYRIQASGNALNANKELMMQAAETLFQISQNSPLMQGDLVKQWAVVNNFLHKSGIQDPTPYIGTQQEAQQKQQEAQSAPAPSPVEMVQVSGKLDEITTLALILQKDPGIAQSLMQAMQIYQQAGATMASAAAAGAVHGTIAANNATMNQPQPGSPGSAQAGGINAGGMPSIPTDPNNPQTFPDQIANNGAMAAIAKGLLGGKGGS